jgi:hypothetical protein
VAHFREASERLAADPLGGRFGVTRSEGLFERVQFA